MKYAYVLILLIVLSCKEKDPEPTADFTHNLQSSGKVSFNVSSANADSFTWDFGDGQTGAGKSTEHTYDKNGNYIVTMTAKGKGGEVVKQQTVNISNITGNAMFYFLTDPRSIIRVTIANKTAEITGYFQAEPACGSQGNANFPDMDEGKYNYSAEQIGPLSPKKWSGTIDVYGNECSKIRLSL